MKMSYRDRMILLIVIIVALILVGIFLIIKPTATKISENKVTLSSVESEVDRINGIIDQIPKLEEAIQSEYNESKVLAANFTDDRVTFVADQFIQEYFNDNEVMVLSLAANEATSETIEFYSYVPNVVTYPLLEAADLNGDIATETAEKLKASTVFSELEAQEIEMYSLEIQFYGKKDGILNLIDSIRDIDGNIIITDFSIDDYTFAADDDSTSTTNQKDYSQGSMNIKFYVLEPIAEPSLS